MQKQKATPERTASVSNSYQQLKVTINQELPQLEKMMKRGAILLIAETDVLLLLLGVRV
jgi:16S rRNA C1402 N4-methylase RsmH